VKILSPLFAASYLGVCFDHIYATKILFEVWQLPPIALWWPAAALKEMSMLRDGMSSIEF
jgi:hypothetical protein